MSKDIYINLNPNTHTHSHCKALTGFVRVLVVNYSIRNTCLCPCVLVCYENVNVSVDVSATLLQLVPNPTFTQITSLCKAHIIIR